MCLSAAVYLPLPPVSDHPMLMMSNWPDTLPACFIECICWKMLLRPSYRCVMDWVARSLSSDNASLLRNFADMLSRDVERQFEAHRGARCVPRLPAESPLC